MKENDTEDINTEILTILSNRINDMYNNMFLLFPVEKTSLSDYIEFCSNNVSKQLCKYNIKLIIKVFIMAINSIIYCITFIV